MKNVCCFFGHSDTPHAVAENLERAAVDLIENNGVDTFYVGNHGSFDAMARKALKILKEKYPLQCCPCLYADSKA